MNWTTAGTAIALAAMVAAPVMAQTPAAPAAPMAQPAPSAHTAPAPHHRMHGQARRARPTNDADRAYMGGGMIMENGQPVTGGVSGNMSGGGMAPPQGASTGAQPSQALQGRMNPPATVGRPMGQSGGAQGASTGARPSQAAPMGASPAQLSQPPARNPGAITQPVGGQQTTPGSPETAGE